MKTNSPKSLQIAAAALAAALLGAPPLAIPAGAAIIDWTGATNGIWTTTTNWAGNALPQDDLTSDIARFNVEADGTTTISNFSVNGLIFGDGVGPTNGARTLQVNGGNFLNIGSSGIVLNSNSGAVNITGAVRLGANQTWANHSASLFTIGTLTNQSNVNPVILTFGGSGAFTSNGVISDGGGTGTTALVVNKTSGIVSLTSANTFSGGVTVKSGTLSASLNKAALGTGTLTLGDTSGSADVTFSTSLSAGVHGAVTNNIHVMAGSTGTIKFENIASARFDGTVLLERDLLVDTPNSALTFGGAFSGTGNLIIARGTQQGSKVAFNADAFYNVAGTVINNANSLEFAGGVGPNVTQIVQSGTYISAGVVIKDKALQVNSAGTRLTISSDPLVKAGLLVSGGVIGTGNLILENDSSTIPGANANPGLLFSTTAVNHSGDIINKGTGSALASYARFHTGGVIGANVRNIIQQSATSDLRIADGLVIGSDGKTLINDGGGKIWLETTSLVSGTGNLVLKNNSSVNDAIVSGTDATVGINHLGSITNSGTGTGSVSLSRSIGTNVTQIIQDSATSELKLGQANTFTGDTRVLQGTLSIINTNALQFSTLNISAGARATASVTAVTLGGLAGSGTFAAVNNTTLTVGASNKNTTFSGTITGNTPKLIKTGTGNLTLVGNQTFNQVTINSGALLISTAHVASSAGTGTGNVTVNSGGSLGGIGNIRPTDSNTKIAVNSGGYITPGDRTNGDFGKLIFDGSGTNANLLTMAAGAKFSFRIGENFESDSIDFWNYAGQTDFLRDDNVIEITLAGNVQAGSYNLFNFYEDSGEVLASGGFTTGLSVVFLNGGAEGHLTYEYGQINLEVTFIPEPSTWTLLAGSLLAAAAFRRRSKLAA